MLEAWLVYGRRDIEKNTFFIQKLIEEGKKHLMHVTLKVREELVLGILNNQPSVVGVEVGELPQCVINRSRDAYLGMHFEKMGIRVFNGYPVTAIANDKIKTHQFVSELGIPAVNTLFWNCEYMTSQQMYLDYPVVVKTRDGHGGNQVFKVEDEKAFIALTKDLGEEHLVVQEVCSRVGVDVRTFVLGGHIVGAIKRTSYTDFRSNYSLGGETEVYTLKPQEQAWVERISQALKCDLVGIDFMIDAQGNFIFNEIEDVVGCRSLYKHSDKDIASLYMAYIKKEMCTGTSHSRICSRPSLNIW